MENVTEYVRSRLFALRDEAYAEFQAKLIPNIDAKNIIGIRTPVLKNFAKEFFVQPIHNDFMQSLPHESFDENNLHAFLICRIRDFNETMKELERFLPYVDNWATCDQLRPKALSKNKPLLLEKIKEWIISDKPYIVRFAIGMLMTHFLGENYRSEYAELVCSVESDEYYVKMMCAWYFATALAKNYDDIIPFLEEKKLEKWIHNKTIQKATESYRITESQKSDLKMLRIK